MELNQFFEQIKDGIEREDALRKHLQYEEKSERLEEVMAELEQPEVWADQEKATALNREKVSLENTTSNLDFIKDTFVDSEEMLAFAEEENDQETVDSVILDINLAIKKLEDLEFRRMFSGEVDANNAYIDVQSGSGGTEAQDWANMILRMYLRFCDSKGFKVDIMEESPGDVAGIKSATIHIQGEYAYGWLRTETGTHRLVRKSPFDSNSKRHTSFASIFVSPEVDDSFEVDINPADLRIDTYRASGAGGQHVNKTESAVRITHLPTNTVTQCQNGRSQHQNKDTAMKQLKAKLYELEMQKRNAESRVLEDSKSDVSWGTQIRSYVLDSGRIKDLRTGYESTNTQAVLDGDLENFIKASLKQGV